jgi:hypothetical protein
LLPAVSLLQGCDLAVTGVITYDAAVSSQEHAAYTEYLFATQAENKPLQQANRPCPSSLKKNGEQIFTGYDSHTLIITRGRSPQMGQSILLKYGRKSTAR